MKQPLTLLLYEKILPGGQLVNRLQDLGYRVQSLSDPAQLVHTAAQETPLLIVADLEPRPERVCESIAALRANAATAHIPVIAIKPSAGVDLEESARQAGANLVVHDHTILLHLEQFLDQALQID